MVGQRLVNRYPIWTRTRLDPSSLGYRLFGVWGEYFDFAYAENKRILADSRLLKRGLGIGAVYLLELGESDQMSNIIAPAGELVWTYPSLTGTIGVTDYNLSRADSIEELLWEPITRLTLLNQYGVDNFLVHSNNRSGTIVNNPIEYPSHLLVKIGESTDFFKRTRFRNTRASGKHRLTLKGKDINWIDIEETIFVKDDDYYVTRNIFRELTEVIPEGFNGAILITLQGVQEYEVDFFKVLITDEDEGPLKLSLNNQVVGLDTYAWLYYFSDLAKTGEDYRDGVIQIVPNEVDRLEQYLVDNVGDPYEALDIKIHPNNARLYCLGTNGYVHVYDHGPSSFGPPSLQEDITRTSYIEIIPVKYYVRFNETLKMFTRFVRIRHPIIGVEIKRISPLATITYLQADKVTWNPTPYEFLGSSQLAPQLAEESWQDIAFTSEFDEEGQWEFYSTTRSRMDTTVSYTGVMVDVLRARASLNAGVTNPIALWFSPADELMITSSNNGPGGEANSFYAFQEHVDTYLADTANQVLYLREVYDAVEVV